MLSMSLKTLSIIWWEKNSFEKNARESTAILTTKRCRENQKVISFGQMMQQFLSLALQFKCKCQYEGVNWELIRSKYEKMLELIVESYPKTKKLSSSVSMLPPLSRTHFVLIQYFVVHISNIVQKITSLQILFHYTSLRRA